MFTFITHLSPYNLFPSSFFTGLLVIFSLFFIIRVMYAVTFQLLCLLSFALPILAAPTVLRGDVQHSYPLNNPLFEEIQSNYINIEVNDPGWIDPRLGGGRMLDVR